MVRHKVIEKKIVLEKIAEFSIDTLSSRIGPIFIAQNSAMTDVLLKIGQNFDWNINEYC
jgi:hypothetical protein